MAPDEKARAPETATASANARIKRVPTISPTRFSDDASALSAPHDDFCAEAARPGADHAQLFCPSVGRNKSFRIDQALAPAPDRLSTGGADDLYGDSPASQASLGLCPVSTVRRGLYLHLQVLNRTRGEVKWRPRVILLITTNSFLCSTNSQK